MTRSLTGTEVREARRLIRHNPDFYTVYQLAKRYRVTVGHIRRALEKPVEAARGDAE